MSRKFLTALDLAKNELQNAQVHNLASAPSSPVKGQLYMNTTDNTLYWWDGTTWQPAKSGAPAFGNVVTETAFGQASANGVATTVARSDHTHGSPTHVAADHSTFPLNTFAVPTANIPMGLFKFTNHGIPSAANDVATKQYVDDLVAGLAWKDAARAATTANITLSGTQTIDGVAVVANDRVLVKNQTTASANGIYVVAAGAWTRASDANTEPELVGAAVFVSEGTTLGDTAWVMTVNAPITVDTTNLTWVQFAGGGAVTAGAGLTQTGNVLDVGAATGIVVTADTVGLDTAYTNAQYAWSSRTVTAGAGLTGGGDLTASRTLDVGAGTGITVAADTVALDTTYTDGRYVQTANAPKRYAVDVGGATSQVLTHNLNTLDVIVQVYRKAGPNDQIECDVEHTSVNTSTVRFAVAPSAAEYRAVVLA